MKTKGQGNVFGELGFAPEEAENLRIRADLMIELTKVIRSSRLTQEEAAQFFGVSQPRISNLIRGKINLFSIDMLVNMLAKAGVEVVVEVR